MPEASARRLPDDQSFEARPAAARLRVVGDGPASGSAPRRLDDSTPWREERRPAGRPHPRSRIRPETASGAHVLENHAARVAAASAPRTIVVTGQRSSGPREARWADRGHRRPSPTVARTVAQPDRLAMWAVGLGLVLAFLAAATAQAEEPGPAPASSAAVAER